MKNPAGKIKSLGVILKIIQKARRNGKVVVTTNGCFDVIHAGHVSTLEWAKKQGDVLIVGINSDVSTRAIKGPRRPIIPQKERTWILAGLSAVDYVFVFSSRSPISWLKKVKPRLHVKGRGSEKDPRLLPETKVVKAGGGRVVFAPKIKGWSTTDIIDKILDRYRIKG